MMYPLTSGGSTTLSVTGIRRYRPVMANSLPRRCPDTLINTDQLSEKVNEGKSGRRQLQQLRRPTSAAASGLFDFRFSGGSRTGPDYPARWIWFSITEADMAHL